MHRFILEPYKGSSSRHSCPNCESKRQFSRYIDQNREVELPSHVGRCNREDKCGYHLTPREYFDKNPHLNNYSKEQTYQQPYRPKPIKPTSYIDDRIMEQTLKNYGENRLFQYLTTLFEEAETTKLMQKYQVGTAKYWHGSTLFWQTDSRGRVRTGKIMLYNPETGKRVKKPYNRITWVHSQIKEGEFNLKQCFFGEHLLSQQSLKPVAIVESEKSALIASMYIPKYRWIASGGKNGCFKDEKLEVLRGRDVILFPDLGATDLWREKALNMNRIGIKTTLFYDLENRATPQQKEAGLDIADFLIRSKYSINSSQSRDSNKHPNRDPNNSQNKSNESCKEDDNKERKLSSRELYIRDRSNRNCINNLSSNLNNKGESTSSINREIKPVKKRGFRR